MKGVHAILADATDPEAAVFGEHVDRQLVRPVFVLGEQVGDIAFHPWLGSPNGEREPCRQAIRASPLRANSDPSRRRYRVARQRIKGVPIQLPRRTQDCFQRLVDYRLIQTSLDRRSMPPGHSADAMGSRRHRAVLSPRDSREMHPKYPKARPWPIADRSS